MNGKGYVYAIENNGKVKIGSTINPKSRLRNIQTQGGFISANIYLSNQLYAYQDLEILIHKNLGDFRDIGEWFNVDFDSACKEIEDGYKQLKSSDQEAKKKEIALSAGSAIAMIAEKLIAEGNSRNAAIVQMSQASWTSEAMDFVLSKPQGAIDIILGVLFMCPTVTIIDGDDAYIAFPYGFQITTVDEIKRTHDKLEIAQDCGCEVEDVPDWDEYSADITGVN
ncbi:GIY-YIG nuclease family protein [Providencia rettgeri]|uniref:GIY-YIG nuclease family protein n=1 Tax=Providencia TaxID=586 RepID=UPI001B36E449|nr:MULTISPECIES: GIY-YIG nuclease family protein [Providencia]EJD6508489.1 GIY-YIG nuclease family protein [Providencia rettgeri]MBQ0210154.1 GIY-YIG nuclease family protein [Providencia rettgeri]MBQ0262568.1 GIY-YIG nuclease family protein [Providencia rettgeri]